MTACIYQVTPSMDRSPRGWAVIPGPPPEGVLVLGRFATMAEALEVRDAACMVHDLSGPRVAAALAAYRAVDAPAHQARRDMERAARDLYLASTEPARRAWLKAEHDQKLAVLAVLPPME